MLEVSSIVIQWIFFAYLSYRIGNKIHIKKSYPWYLIPLWNFLVLVKASDIKIKKFIKTLFLMIFIYMLFSLLYIIYINVHFFHSTINIDDIKEIIFMLSRFNSYFVFVVIKIFIIIFWASVAEKMGKEYGVYILFGLLSIYLAPLLLAFDSIDKFFTSHSMFRLSQEEKEFLSISGEAMDMRGKKINYGIVYLLVSMLLATIYSSFSH